MKLVYVDKGVLTLYLVTEKRIRGYRGLGYSVERPGGENAL